MSLDVFVDCETYDTEQFFLGLGESTTTQKNVPYLDVSAAYHQGEITVCVVNRHKDKTMTADIIAQEGQFAGKFKVFEVNGPNTKAQNGFGNAMVKTVEKPNLAASGQRVTYTFPPHSFTLLKGMMAEICN
jgi:alpha-N-arabinofuranosidase